MDYQHISADPELAGEMPFLGSVDGFDVAVGISGWVVDAVFPAQAVDLELLVDGTSIVGAKVSRFPRDDLAAFFPNHASQAGFLVNLPNWERFENLIKIRPSADFSIRIAGTGFILPKAESCPKLRAVVEESALANANTHIGFDLLTHLSHLTSLAAPLLRLPLRPIEQGRKGLIEAICIDDQDSRLCWFLGWTLDASLRDEPAVLLDNQKIAASFSVITYPRDDLPAECKGVIGVIVSDWRPRSDSDPVLCFGSDGKFNIRGVRGLKSISKAEFVGHVNFAREKWPIGLWSDFVALLHGSHSWFPTADSRPDVRAAVDRLFILPGFGCFATGWVLSSVQEVQGFAVKIGNTVLSMERSSLYFHPRPDLLSAFPDGDNTADNSEFVCFFPGQFDIALIDNPLLKVFLEPKGATVHPVQPAKIRRLGQSATLDDLLEIYPAIQTESFFLGLAEFIRGEHRKIASKLKVYKIAPAERTVVFALSEDRNDLLLQFEDVQRNAGFLSAGIGFAFIASTKYNHGETVALFKSIESVLPQKCSLVFAQKPDAALYVLDELLLLLSATEFLFVAPRHYLSERGWELGRTLMLDGVETLTFFEAYDPETKEKIEHSGCCFAWSRMEFSTWISNRPILIDGYVTRSEFPCSKSESLQHGSYFSKHSRVSRIGQLLNRTSNE